MWAGSMSCHEQFNYIIRKGSLGVGFHLAYIHSKEIKHCWWTHSKARKDYQFLSGPRKRNLSRHHLQHVLKLEWLCTCSGFSSSPLLQRAAHVLLHAMFVSFKMSSSVEPLGMAQKGCAWSPMIECCRVCICQIVRVRAHSPFQSISCIRYDCHAFVCQQGV